LSEEDPNCVTYLVVRSSMRVIGPQQVLLLLFYPFLVLCEDYYKLLGVSKDADNRDIRKAFKKLALKLHPDKNREENAHEKFLEINKAYEVLKDEELRKKYDLHGEESTDNNNSRNKYQSWNYYHEDFGIYDDDKEIVTLDSNDFQNSVLESHDIWVINFYSPRCSHCHDLAPVWRKVAKDLQGIVRIGAVNCQDEFMLCRQQGITGYPTINLYTVGEGTKKFQGRKEEEAIISFVVRFLPDRMVDLWAGNLDKWTRNNQNRYRSWLVVFCDKEEECMHHADKKLLGAALDSLTSMGLVDCSLDWDICHQLRDQHEEAKMLFYPQGIEKGNSVKLTSSVHDHREIAEEVLRNLPETTKLDTKDYEELRRRLDKDIGPSWLVHFVLGSVGDSLEYKKLGPLMPRLRTAKLDCEEDTSVCSELHISKFPSFAVFKVGGGFELHYGKQNIEDVSFFARLSSQARTMETLTAADFPDIITSGDPVFVDFFAPWCPPCMNLLPQFRKASTFIGGQVSFGTVDCTVQQRICNQHGIRAYPTTIFFNMSKPHKYQGNHDAQEMADFVMDILRPSVVSLNEKSFFELVGRKSEDEMWLVDFFAPWCGPCQQLAPQWRNLAKLVDKYPHVHVAKVDCIQEEGLCSKLGVQSYPTIRMYPLDSVGHTRYQPYSQYHRDTQSLHQWVQTNLPSNVENLTPYSFEHKVLSTSNPWLVEFYAPWCGHCTRFAPEYEQVALAMKGKVKVGKVNCDKYKGMCNKAAITGYPTIRFYRGQEKGGMQDYYSQDIKEREMDKIARVVEQLIKKSQDMEDQHNSNIIVEQKQEVVDENEEYMYDESDENTDNQDDEFDEFDEFDEDNDHEEHEGHDEL